MDLDLKNKNAIVCGSTQGIGEASAIELAKLGANITLIARNESKLLNVLNDLDKSQGQIHSFVCIDFSSLLLSSLVIFLVAVVLVVEDDKEGEE